MKWKKSRRGRGITDKRFEEFMKNRPTRQQFYKMLTGLVMTADMLWVLINV